MSSPHSRTTETASYDADVAEDQPPTDVEAVLREVMAKSNPVQNGPDFDNLVALVEEQLSAQIAMERLGQIEPPAAGIHETASLIADMVDHVYLLERRARAWSNRTTGMLHGAYATFEHETDMAYIYLTGSQDARRVAHVRAPHHRSGDWPATTYQSGLRRGGQAPRD